MGEQIVETTMTEVLRIETDETGAFGLPVVESDFLVEEGKLTFALNEEAIAAHAAGFCSQEAMARADIVRIQRIAWHRTNPHALQWMESIDRDAITAWLPYSQDLEERGLTIRFPYEVLRKIPSWQKVFASIELRCNDRHHVKEWVLLGRFDGHTALLQRWTMKDYPMLTFEEMRSVLEFRRAHRATKDEWRRGRENWGFSGLFAGFALAIIPIFFIWRAFGSPTEVTFAVVPCILVAVTEAILGLNAALKYTDNRHQKSESAMFKGFKAAHPDLYPWAKSPD